MTQITTRRFLQTAGLLCAGLPLLAAVPAQAQDYPAKPIRLVDGDHEISCKMDGVLIGLKACFVKKVTA